MWINSIFQPCIGLESTDIWWTMRTLRTSDGSRSSSKYIMKVEKKTASFMFYNTFLFTLFLCSKYDLYSKSKTRVDVEKVKPYYLSLIEKVATVVVYTIALTIVFLLFIHQWWIYWFFLFLFGVVFSHEAQVVRCSWLENGMSRMICKIVWFGF